MKLAKRVLSVCKNIRLASENPENNTFIKFNTKTIISQQGKKSC